MRTLGNHAAATVEAKPQLPYRRIVVPLNDGPESERALTVACRLVAEERSAVIVAVAAIEMPRELPLAAHEFEAERRARNLLQQARTVAASYGVRLAERVVRTHDVGEAIVAEAERCRADAVVLGPFRTSRRRPVVDETVETVLRQAPCRVLVIAPPVASSISG